MDLLKWVCIIKFEKRKKALDKGLFLCYNVEAVKKKPLHGKGGQYGKEF
jgi:hypothetical protein